jgi:hypothetical protein
VRVSEETRFPYPVLSEGTHDYTEGTFDVDFVVEEKPRTGELALSYEVKLTEPSVRDLVVTGRANLGCFVRCQDTFFSELRPLSFPRGRVDFTPGSLLNRVTLRAFVWLRDDLPAWEPAGVHPEFAPPVAIRGGEIIAVATESTISVGQAKFAALESIFELVQSDALPEGSIRVDLEAEKITILASPVLYQQVNLLRGQGNGAAIVLNAIYLPAIMEVLEVLHGGAGPYHGRRWFQPFMAKCDAKGIDVGVAGSQLERAQTLLDRPLRALSRLVEDDE